MTANAVAMVAFRDMLKFLRDPARIIGTLVFPLIFIGLIGTSLGFVAFAFTGVFAQTLFQSTTFGIISLLEDRENDFSQEMFVAPLSRYALILGKILGETLVSLLQGVAILLFGMLFGVEISLPQLLALLLISIPVCLLGGALGLFLLANLSSQRAANQIFPFLFLPQYFVAGVFFPLNAFPAHLQWLSWPAPMRYAVDVTRGLFFAGTPDYQDVVLLDPSLNLAIMAVLFVLFLVVGTFLFVRKEQNR